MSLENVMHIASTGMNAESQRLNATASNLANAQSISSTEEAAYHAKNPIFSTIMAGENKGGVEVSEVALSQTPIEKQYQPDSPLADKKGFVYLTNVNSVAETANMISASRSYRTNADLLNTSKNLLVKTLTLLEN